MNVIHELQRVYANRMKRAPAANIFVFSIFLLSQIDLGDRT